MWFFLCHFPLKKVHCLGLWHLSTSPSVDGSNTSALLDLQISKKVLYCQGLHHMILYTDFWPSYFTKSLLVLIIYSCQFQRTRALLSQAALVHQQHSCWHIQLSAVSGRCGLPRAFTHKRWLGYGKLKATDWLVNALETSAFKMRKFEMLQNNIGRDK